MDDPTKETHGASPSGDELGELGELAELQVEAEPGQGAAQGDGEQGGVSVAGVGPDGFLTSEAFFAGFRKTHTVSGHFLGLRTLVEAPKMAEAREASDAIYEIARETPALHWLIKPGLKWLQRLAAIGAYAVPVYLACEAELDARRQAVEKTAAAAANDNEREPAEDLAAAEAEGTA